MASRFAYRDVRVFRERRDAVDAHRRNASFDGCDAAVGERHVAVTMGTREQARHGFMLALLYSFYTSAKYVRLWEKQLPPNERKGIRNQGA